MDSNVERHQSNVEIISHAPERCPNCKAQGDSGKKACVDPHPQRAGARHELLSLKVGQNVVRPIGHVHQYGAKASVEYRRDVDMQQIRCAPEGLAERIEKRLLTGLRGMGGDTENLEDQRRKVHAAFGGPDADCRHGDTRGDQEDNHDQSDGMVDAANLSEVDVNGPPLVRGVDRDRGYVTESAPYVDSGSVVGRVDDRSEAQAEGVELESHEERSQGEDSEPEDLGSEHACETLDEVLPGSLLRLDAARHGRIVDGRGERVNASRASR